MELPINGKGTKVVVKRRTLALDVLFPLEGVTLGKTTVADLEKLGKR